MIGWALHGSASAELEGELAVLTAAELASWTRLAHGKRRADWLAGRLSAKAAVQELFARRGFAPPPAPRIAIDNTEDGVPVASLLDPAPLGLGELSLSLSHSGGAGVAVAGDDPHVWLGIDLERIEARSPALVEDFFSTAEQLAVRASPERDRDALVTAIWAAKEAALKAARRGLSMPAGPVSCGVELPGPRWTPVSVLVPDGWLSSATFGAAAGRTLWCKCRRQGPFVVAAAALARGAAELAVTDAPGGLARGIPLEEASYV